MNVKSHAGMNPSELGTSFLVLGNHSEHWGRIWGDTGITKKEAGILNYQPDLD